MLKKHNTFYRLTISFLVFILLSGNTLIIRALEVAQKEVFINLKIESYFDVMYDSYTELKDIDFTDIVFQSSKPMQIKSYALNLLNARRKYISEMNYAYVERNQFAISFEYIDYEKIEDDMVLVTLVIHGDQSLTYPPFFSLGLNEIIVKNSEDGWRIYDHKYDGISLFENKNVIYTIDIDELKAQINDEFTDLTTSYNYSLLSTRYIIPPYIDYVYSTTRAALYGETYYATNNLLFYTANVGSGGDCTNFISQSVWYGFGGINAAGYISSRYLMEYNPSYSLGWYGGLGGGSASWEQANSFWTYMTLSRSSSQMGPRVTIMSSVQSLSKGGVMQIDFEGDGDFDHTVILIDKTLLKFAQHTNNTTNYYSDYIGVKRFLQPNFFRVMD